ncbi:MAG: hypothetical protein ACHQ52_07335 [Candidatus Eisenbacteria bacterium]
MLLRLIPAVLSLLVLGAHFLRRGQLVPCALCVGLALLLGLRRPWVPLLVQAALFAGAILWAGNTVVMVRERAHEGGPVLRLASILGSVTLFTAASAWLVGSRRVRDHYAAPVSPVEAA